MKSIKLFLTLFILIAPLLAQAEDSGTWTKINYSIKGSWTLTTDDNGHVLVLSDDFKTKGAPDLKLFLSPMKVADIDNSNSVEGSYFIAPLKSKKGGQRYIIPATIDLNAYKSIIIHCEKYTKVWGGTDLP